MNKPNGSFRNLHAQHAGLAGIALSLSLAPSLASAALVSIGSGALNADAATLDFESAATGVISDTDSLFGSIGLASVSTVGTFTTSTDTWSSGTDGKGLASRNGELVIVDIGDTIDSLQSGAGFEFDVDGTATQFGFQMVDQTNHLTRIETYFEGLLVDSIAYNPTESFPLPQVFFESDSAFDSIRILANGLNGGWGLDNFTLAGLIDNVHNDVPEPASWALIALGLLGLRHAGRARS